MRYTMIALVLVVAMSSSANAGPFRRYRPSSAPAAPASVVTTATVTKTTPAVTAPAARPASAVVQATAQVVQGENTVRQASGAAPAAPAVAPAAIVNGSDDALGEVNAARAQRGLRPFLPDAQLNQAARSCAKIRATSYIDGHLPSDFAYVPAGTTASAAGCGALEPSWGWGTCCTYDNYTYAGAAWVMGNDGRRYMHLFVR